MGELRSDLGVILSPGTWVRLRCDEGYNMPWEVVGVVAEVNEDRMEAYVQFENGDPYWVPIVDLILLSA